MIPRQIIIDPLSGISLYLQLSVNGNNLGQATGFIVQKDNKNYLITNWHVVSGLDPITGKPLSPTGGLPDTIKIAHHVKDKLGMWKLVDAPLKQNDGPLWLEHPKSNDKNRIDIVALPITNLDDDIAVYPLDLKLSNTDMIAEPAMPVSVIGFPLGLASAGAFPIWKTGHIASDPDLNYQNKPAFLIDATTRNGMSGSPVILRMSGGYRQRNGGIIMAMAGSQTLFLGVYSGRIHSDSEVGLVWRPNLIEEILYAE